MAAGLVSCADGMTSMSGPLAGGQPQPRLKATNEIGGPVQLPPTAGYGTVSGHQTRGGSAPMRGYVGEVFLETGVVVLGAFCVTCRRLGGASTPCGSAGYPGSDRTPSDPAVSSRDVRTLVEAMFLTSYRR